MECKLVLIFSSKESQVQLEKKGISTDKHKGYFLLISRLLFDTRNLTDGFNVKHSLLFSQQ